MGHIVHDCTDQPKVPEVTPFPTPGEQRGYKNHMIYLVIRYHMIVQLHVLAILYKLQNSNL